MSEDDQGRQRLERLDALAARRWALTTRAVFAARRSEIDALNVFPVPDGDTGTNLYLTLDSALDAVRASGARESAGQPDLARDAESLARATLLAARGNSGVDPQPARARAQRGRRPGGGPCRRPRRPHPGQGAAAGQRPGPGERHAAGGGHHPVGRHRGRRSPPRGPRPERAPPCTTSPVPPCPRPGPRWTRRPPAAGAGPRRGRGRRRRRLRPGPGVPGPRDLRCGRARSRRRETSARSPARSGPPPRRRPRAGPVTRAVRRTR